MTVLGNRMNMQKAKLLARKVSGGALLGFRGKGKEGGDIQDGQYPSKRNFIRMTRSNAIQSTISLQ